MPTYSQPIPDVHARFRIANLAGRHPVSGASSGFGPVLFHAAEAKYNPAGVAIDEGTGEITVPAPAIYLVNFWVQKHGTQLYAGLEVDTAVTEVDEPPPAEEQGVFTIWGTPSRSASGDTHYASICQALALTPGNVFTPQVSYVGAGAVNGPVLTIDAIGRHPGGNPWQAT